MLARYLGTGKLLQAATLWTMGRNFQAGRAPKPQRAATSSTTWHNRHDRWQGAKRNGEG